jgi:predicted ATPase/DNA-binding SARP family transcriptional activator
MGLEVRILGPLEVVVDGERRRLGGGKQRSLLALLALAPGEVVSADRLIEALWPEYDPRARARLHVYVSQTRKALGSAGRAIDGRSEGYALDVGPDGVDAWRFERMAAAGANALGAGDPEAAARTLREALDLWRGAALEDCACGALVEPTVTRLGELRLAALEDRIEADLACGGADELLPELEALVAEQPLRERLRAAQMLALHRAGRRAEALDAYGAARRGLVDDLGLEPGPDLRRLHDAIARDDPSLHVEPAVLRARRHLPAPATALVGRRAQLDDLVALLGTPGVRLLTVTGAGGAGKTRLAIQAAAELAASFDDGVYFVELAPLEDAALVPQAVAHALGVVERADEPLAQTLAEHLHGRRLLLVLDNFEHVDAAAPLVGSLLAAAPELKVLATSRAPLRLGELEREYQAPPLTEAEAVALFMARAGAARHGFQLTSADVGPIARLCANLDGLPLAIELAAARTRTLSVQELLASLPGALDLAAEGPRDLPARQRTLRATIDWSYRLLGAHGRELLDRLAVFVGGFTAQQARDVCAADRAALAGLEEESLLVPRVGGAGEPRLDMLETVREYAHERLEEGGDGERVRARHAEHFVALAEEADPAIAGPAAEDWLARLEDDHANLRAALAWAGHAGALEVELRLAGALARFWELRHLREGRAHLEAAVGRRAADQPPALRAKALLGVTRVTLSQGDYGRMRSAAAESLELLRSLGDERGVARALGRLATAVSNEGDYDRGAALYEESAAIYRALDDDIGLGATLNDLGCLALMQGDPDRAAELSEAGLAHYAKAGERYAQFYPLFNLALARLWQGRRDEARERFVGGLELARDLRYDEQVVYFLEGLAAAHAADGEHERAATLLGATDVAAAQLGVLLEPLERAMRDQAVAAATAALGEGRFAAAEAAGRALGQDAAVAYALASPR